MGANPRSGAGSGRPRPPGGASRAAVPTQSRIALPGPLLPDARFPARLCCAHVSRAHFCFAFSVSLKRIYTTNLRLLSPEPLPRPQIPWLPLAALYDEVVIALIISCAPLASPGRGFPRPMVQGPGSSLQSECLQAVSHTHLRLCILSSGITEIPPGGPLGLWKGNYVSVLVK